MGVGYPDTTTCRLTRSIYSIINDQYDGSGFENKADCKISFEHRVFPPGSRAVEEPHIELRERSIENGMRAPQTGWTPISTFEDK